MSKNKIGILASTAGTDMQAVIDAIEDGSLDAEITVVISNKPDNYALTRAKKHGLNVIFINPKGKNREEYDREVSKVLEKNEVDLILFIGYMRLTSDWFVYKYINKVMNIHPSLLPAYQGGINMNVHEDVLERGCKITGASLIFIDNGADTGPIILQKAVNVNNDETPLTLKDKVQEAEAEIILEGIKLYFDGRLKVEDRRVRILDQKKSS